MMKTMYETDYGERYEDYNDAIQSVTYNMSLDELFTALEDTMSMRTLLEWAWKQPDFVDRFCDEICEAEDKWAQQYVTEIEVEEEDEDNAAD